MKAMRTLGIVVGHFSALAMACTGALTLTVSDGEVDSIRAARAGGDRIQFQYYGEGDALILKAGVPSGINWGTDGKLAGFNLAPTESSSEPIDAKRIVGGTVAAEQSSRGPTETQVVEQRVMLLRASRRMDQVITLNTKEGAFTGVVQNIEFEEGPTVVHFVVGKSVVSIRFNDLIWD